MVAEGVWVGGFGGGRFVDSWGEVECRRTPVMMNHSFRVTRPDYGLSGFSQNYAAARKYGHDTSHPGTVGIRELVAELLNTS